MRLHSFVEKLIPIIKIRCFCEGRLRAKENSLPAKNKKKKKRKMENSFVYCFSGDETRYNILAEPLWIQAVLSLSDPITAEEAWPTFLRPVKLICAMSKICQDGSNIVAGEAVKLTHDHGLAQSVLFILSPETEDKKKFLAKLMPGSLQTHHSL